MLAKRILVATAAAAVLLAGCGSDGDDDGSSGSTDGSSSSGALDASGDIALAGPADEGIDGVESYRVTSNDHTSRDIDYPVLPPPGGPHHDVWVNCGFHDEAFDDENLVHDLEHGAIWLAYSPTLADADVDVIRQLAADHKVVAAPYEHLEAGEAVVATAWARQLRLESVDDPRLVDFVVQYEDGSQAPEAGVTCTGTPLG